MTTNFLKTPDHITLRSHDAKPVNEIVSHTLGILASVADVALVDRFGIGGTEIDKVVGLVKCVSVIASRLRTKNRLR